MSISRRVALRAALCLLLASCTKSSAGGQTGDEDTFPSGEELFGELGKRGGSMNYQPARDVAELADWSERVVVGRAAALRAGRTLDWFGSQVHTVVLELEVERTLKGPPEPSLKLEFIIGAEDAAPPKQLPEARLLAFATPSDWLGAPRVEGLYQLTTPQGLAVEGDGTFSRPLEPTDRAFGDGDFADLIARVAAAVAGEERRAGAGDAGAQSDGAASSADAGGCAREFPFPSGATPSTCPAQCVEVRASPFSAANACIDYASTNVVGCLDGEGPPVIVCVERTDGQRFLIGSGWAFPSSTTYTLCNEAVTMTVTQAPRCP